MAEACLVLTAFESREQAQPTIVALISEQLASCVQVYDVDSMYVWQGEVVSCPETVLSIRTTKEAYPRLERRLFELHPYELPEIIQIPVTAGLAPYIDWIAENSLPRLQDGDGAPQRNEGGEPNQESDDQA